MDMRATPEDENTVDRLWAAAADRIHSARGWALRPLGQMGRLRQDRYTWLADGPTGTVVVKVSANEFAYDRAAWATEALSLLRARGMPVPVPLWWGQLDRPWWALLQPRLPGDRIDALQAPLLDELVALIELQAGLGLVLGKAGWDVSWWIDVVVFEGWEGWWNGAEQAAPHTARRLRAFLEPARGYRLPVADLVHGDFGIGNVLARGGAVTAVVDWDHLGVGSRALDLASLLFDWQRLRLASPASAAPGGGERVRDRIVEIAGEHGLRCCVCYAAIARLALGWQQGQQDDVDMWRAVTESILDSLEGD